MTTISPYVTIAVGFLGTGLCGWASLPLYMNGSAILSANDLEYSVGSLARSEKVPAGNKSSTLQVWLQGKPLPFVADTIEYPKFYDRDVLGGLAPGAKLRIGYQRKSIASPDFNFMTNQAFHYIETLDINDRPALTLAASNIAKYQNAQFRKIVSPILFIGSISVLVVGIIDLKKAPL